MPGESSRFPRPLIPRRASHLGVKLTDFVPMTSRQLELRLEDGEVQVVEVQFSAPRPSCDGDDPSRDDYFCDYRILGLGEDKVRRIYGYDGVQALWLALSLAGVDLTTTRAASEGRLTFDGEGSPFGFPDMEGA